MGKWRVEVDGVLEDEVFDTEEEAEEYASELESYAKQGAETLHWSNPSEYEYDEDNFDYPDIDIYEE